MKKQIKIGIISILILFSVTLKAQILISLVLGDALNTPKIEFGIIGGLNRSYLNDLTASEGLNHFNMGFYFHVNLKNNSFLSTGLWVKSNVGATGIPVYSIGDANFDSLYHGGTLTKKISCFYVPIMYHYRIKNRWYIEAGPQAGLRTKALDVFETSKLDGDLLYTKVVKDQYRRLDFGFVGGVGYKFKKELKTMAVGVSYYYGMVNVSLQPDITMKNSSLNFYMKIPIGLGAKDSKVE